MDNNDMPCRVCQGTAGQDCRLCKGAGFVVSEQALLSHLEQDPFAQAAATGRELRIGGQMPKAPRNIVRASWPFRDAVPAKAKPSRWPY